VWLDAERTSPFRFYQFWLNAADDDARTFLRYFTLLTREEIEALDTAMEAEPHRRAAQHALAEDVTRRVHGEDGLARAVRASEALFGGSLEGLSAAEIADIFADVPASSLPRHELEGEGKDMLDLLAATDLAASRGEARRSVEGGGIYLNGARVQDARMRVQPEDAIEGRFLVLRKGKKRYHLVRLEG
jgi:tyrosyl-tRNA synthetase